MALYIKIIKKRLSPHEVYLDIIWEKRLDNWKLVIDTLSKDLKDIDCPAGTNKIYLDDVCYELDRETDTLTICSEGNFNNFLKKRTFNLINRFGLRTINILKISAISLSILLFLLLFFKIFLKGADSLLSLILISASLISFIVASHLYEIVNYCNIFRCKKCGQDFAYEEMKKPLIKMVSTYNKYEKTITSYMKCKYCNNENVKVEIAHRNSKSNPKNIYKNRKTCKGCGNKFSLIEYRYPDAHLEYYNRFRTIRHYKCTDCGYMEISIKDDYVDVNRI